MEVRRTSGRGGWLGLLLCLAIGLSLPRVVSPGEGGHEVPDDANRDSHIARRARAAAAASAAEGVLQAQWGRDYILPGEAPASGRFVLGPRRPAKPAGVAGADTSPCIDCAETVTYTAFDGAVYQLQAFRGKNVALLLPDSWLGAAGLTADERRDLLDRSDWFYEHYKELMQAEPAGSGLLTIAGVPVTCGGGCGLVGAKGIEFAADPGNFNFMRPEIAADKVPGVIVHEMSHNFDIHSSYLSYLPEHGHAWTTFMGEYSAVYARLGMKDFSPADLEDYEVRKWYRPYYQDPTADWAECVRDGLCEGRGIYRNDAWGGITQRFAQIHGPEAVRGAMAFLNAYEQTYPEPSGAEAREDLHIEAMAAGAGLDLGCYVDTWRWNASPALRARMTSTYGAINPYCADADADGFSVLAGDCNDGSSAVHPGATETVNGVDDDCDGQVDDLLAAEPVAGDFPNPTSLSFPAQVRGLITAGDGDFFLVTLPSTPGPHAVEINLCSEPDFQGWLFVYDQGGNWLDYQFVPKGQCSAKTYALTGGLTWRIGVELNTESLPGAYHMVVATKRPWPATWGSAEPVTCASGYRLRSTTQSLSGALTAPDRVRFWVSGVGFVGSTAYASSAASSWLPAQIRETTQGYRAELLAGPTPVEDATAARWFSATDCPVLEVSDLSVTEGNAGTRLATFAATLSSASSQTVTVGYGTADGTATVADGDFMAASGTLTFNPGITSQLFSVTVNGDTRVEATETFFVNLSAATNAPIADSQGFGTLVNDDGPSLSIGGASVAEGRAGRTTAIVTVTLSAASGLAVQVHWATANGTAQGGADFVPGSGTLVFDPGVTSRTVSVEVLGDTLGEGNETFAVVLSAPDNAAIGSGTGTITIVDDDPIPGFYAVSPCRLIDTRDPAAPRGGPALQAETTRTFSLVGACGLPDTAKAISVNATVTSAAAGGHLRLHAGGVSLPTVSAVNYSAGQTRANSAIVALGSDGTLAVFVGQPAGTVHLILDVNGYFQ